MRLKDVSSAVRVLLTCTWLAVACRDSTSPERTPTDLGIVYSFAPKISGQLERDFFLSSADGTSSRQLIHSPDDKRYPSWSPDGRTLAFFRQGLGAGGAWLANADGSKMRQVPGVDGIPRWSPDGAWLIFLHPDAVVDQVRIEAVHPDGSGRRQLVPGVAGINTMRTAPSWSSSGRIAFTRSNGLEFDAGNIWTAAPDGSGLTQVTTGSRDEMPIWSPDARMLAFTSSTPGNAVFQVAVVNADGSGRRTLTTETGRIMDFVDAWSPDGQWLLFRRSVYPDDCGYYKVAVAGGEPIRVSPPVPLAYTFESCGGASWR